MGGDEAVWWRLVRWGRGVEVGGVGEEGWRLMGWEGEVDDGGGQGGNLEEC